MYTYTYTYTYAYTYTYTYTYTGWSHKNVNNLHFIYSLGNKDNDMFKTHKASDVLTRRLLK